MFMMVFGHQTMMGILPRGNVPHITGRNGDFSTKETKISILNNIILLKILHNILLLCTQFLGKKKLKMLNNLICVLNTVVINHFFCY